MRFSPLIKSSKALPSCPAFQEGNNMIKFPYGISDFQSIIVESYFYIDRTDRIPLLEEAGKHLLFLRPRRFGKSLLISMLENYYDLKRGEQFNTLFGHLSIGRNPTSLHNQYLILKWDFSAVNPVGDAQQIVHALHRYINRRIEAFADYYEDYLSHKIDIVQKDSFDSFQSLLIAVQKTPYRLYLLIDEYDNFANEIMMGSQKTDEERYKKLLYGEGSFKSLFKVVKSATSGQGLDRIFIVGVSPVVLSDITSGYNIAHNISLNKRFNHLCGFWESEIDTALCQITKECDFPQQESAHDALSMMRTFYNGYCFCQGKASLVYNPTLALYFFNKFQEDCKYPRTMLDSNLAMDREKIRYISQLPKGDYVIASAFNEANPLSISEFADHFGLEDMLHKSKDHTFMSSLLYYFGVLTIGGDTPFGETILKIPNLVVRKLYVEQIQDMLLPDFQDKEDALEASKALYQKGDIQPLCDFMETRYFKLFDNRDYRWANELTVKIAFLTLLFNDTFYIMDSETELERGYADFTMIVRPDMRHFQLLDILIEFKYISLTDAGLTGEKAKKARSDELKAIPAVKHKLRESQSNLTRYSEILEKKYGSLLRLHSFSVTAVGFERLVWSKGG
jgi:hypothetical protein